MYQVYEIIHSAEITSVSAMLTVALGTWLTYLFTLVTYRLYFSPIRHIPGPLLARTTYLYEFYYDVVCHGRYLFRIPALHEMYGPVIRINPHEVHIHDPDFYDEVYSGASRKRDKWHFQSGILDLEKSAFGTLDHDTHRMRRSALNPYFSNTKIRNLQPVLMEMLGRVIGRFEELGRQRRPILLSFAAAALANDVVTQYAFGHNDQRIERPDFDRAYTEAVDTGAMLAHTLKHIPRLYILSTWLPPRLQATMAPELRDFINAKQHAKDVVTKIYNHRHTRTNQEATIFHGLLNSSLCEAEKKPQRLWAEGYVTVAAGTLTTSNAISVICYRLLSQPNELRKLKEELEANIPDTMTACLYTKLEGLPYLTAVIKEGLRTSQGVTYRMARIAQDEDLEYTSTDGDGKVRSYEIPRGTPISMTHHDIHLSPTHFKNPEHFRPERWLSGQKSDKYLVAFSRGTRQCAGVNLAWMELYATIAVIFRRFGSKDVRRDGDPWLELYETSEADIEIQGDGSTPLYRKGDRVKVLVHG